MRSTSSVSGSICAARPREKIEIDAEKKTSESQAVNLKHNEKMFGS